MADGIRVLYVDDEPSLLEIAKLFLEEQGEFIVETATSARGALDTSSIPSFDVIVSDYQMPGMDGIAFLKEVRKQFGDLPFILFTGRGREEIVIQAINNGADFYIQKGGDPEAQFAELAHKIRQAVSRKRSENALHESERRLRLLIQDAPAALAMFDREMRYIVASRRWIMDYHLGDRELLGRSHYEIFPEISEEIKVIHRRSLRGEVLSSDEDKFIRQDGSVQWLAWEVRPWYETGNVIGGLIIFSEDITTRKKDEETIAKSKDYLDQIFSSVQAGIVIIDSKTHQILDINPAGAAMIGLPKEQITGNTCHKFICPTETGQCPITDLHNKVDNAERILITGDGKKIPIIKYVTRTNLDGRECLLETFIDNSERRRAEDALRKSEEKYRLLTEVTDDIVYMVDLQGTLTHISPQISRYGYKQEEVISHNFTEFIAKEDIPNVIADFKNVVSTRTQTVTTTRICDKAGGLHWMEDNGAPVIDASGSVVAISGILRNITARKEAEDAQKESEEKFRSIFENSPYPIAINSIPDNTFLEVNKAFLDISGYTPAELLGKDPMELGFLPLTEALKLVSHRLLTGKIENVPLAVTVKDGKRVHVLFSTMPIAINKKPALVTVTTEVTKLKRIEEELIRKNEELNSTYEELTATNEELRQNYDEISKKEEVLRASEEKFRALVEHSLDGILILDPHGKILFANHAAGKIIEDENIYDLIGVRNVMEFIAPESRADVIRDFRTVATGVDGYLAQYKLTTVNQKERWVESMGKTIIFDGAAAILISLRDISERVVTYSALQTIVGSMVGTTGLNSLRKIAENVSSWLGADCVMVGEIQPDNQTVKVLSMQLDGKAVEDFIYTLKGTPCENVAEKGFCHYPDDAIRLFPKSKDLVELNIRGYIGTPLKNSDGKVIGILCALFRNPFQSSPTIQQIMAIIAVKAGAEIERSQIEHALRQSEEKFRSIVETSPDMIWEIDMQGNFRYISPMIQAIMGYSQEELSGKSILDLVPERVRSAALQELMHMISSEGTLSPIEFPARHRDGSDILLEIRPARLTDTDGRLVGLRGVAVDITNRKRAEDALRQANRKLNLLSGITRHDIMNQITVLNGFTALLKAKIPDPSLGDYVSRISKASNHIASLIQFTKEYEEIGVHAPAWQNLRALADNAARDALTESITSCNDLPAGCEIFADPLIAKVFFNLADNAVRHAETITILRFKSREEGGALVVVCEDDGTGVTACDKERIFERGFGKNTGFGLAISREILDLTGITMVETGEPGKGARFEMTFPEGTYRFIQA